MRNNFSPGEALSNGPFEKILGADGGPCWLYNERKIPFGLGSDAKIQKFKDT